MNHGILEGLQEILLELKIGQLFLLQKSHRELTKGIQREKADMWVIMATNLFSWIEEQWFHGYPFKDISPG